MAKKAKHIDINYRPLHTSGSIEVVGSVPTKQIYQSVTGEYLPDYTLTPLVLMPICNAVDYDAVSKSGRINSSLTNMVWYERIGTERTPISNGTGYTIVMDGNDKGKITVKKNVQPLVPVTLEFRAEYIDPRTQQVFKYQMSVLVTSSEMSDVAPNLVIDSPDTMNWNPVREEGTLHTITAKAFLGNDEVTDKCKFFFFKGEDMKPITDGSDDWEFVSKTNNSLTIDKNYIGDGETYLVKFSYSKEGTPSDTPDENLDGKRTTIVRFIPKFECDWEGVPTGVNGGIQYIYPTPIVTDPMGIVDLPEEMFRFYWNVRKKGTSEYVRVADCKNPRIEVSDGMSLQLEVEDRGALCYVMDEGKMVCSDGKPIVVRKNG